MTHTRLLRLRIVAVRAAFTFLTYVLRCRLPSDAFPRALRTLRVCTFYRVPPVTLRRARITVVLPATCYTVVTRLTHRYTTFICGYIYRSCPPLRLPPRSGSFILTVSPVYAFEFIGSTHVWIYYGIKRCRWFVVGSILVVPGSPLVTFLIYRLHYLPTPHSPYPCV